MMEAYPLHWPDGWERTPRRMDSQFSTTLGDARDGLLSEIRLMGGSNVVISSNLSTRRDGLPYAKQRNPDDPGVAVYFTLKKQPRCFACDRFHRVQDNLQAVRKTIEALRGIERWGSSEMLNRVFQGFAALPDVAPEPSWADVLGVTTTWGLEAIEKVYRALAREHHPDRGGDAETMARLNWAIGEARKSKARP